MTHHHTFHYISYTHFSPDSLRQSSLLPHSLPCKNLHSLKELQMVSRSRYVGYFHSILTHPPYVAHVTPTHVVWQILPPFRQARL